MPDASGAQMWITAQNLGLRASLRSLLGCCEAWGGLTVSLSNKFASGLWLRRQHKFLPFQFWKSNVQNRSPWSKARCGQSLTLREALGENPFPQSGSPAVLGSQPHISLGLPP